MLTLTALIGVPEVRTGDDLVRITLDAVKRSGFTLEERDVLVFAQKIVSKAEGRSVYLKDIVPSSEAYQIADEVEKDPRLVELILRESRQIIRKRPGLIIAEHNQGFICANAGIDHSNVSRDTDQMLLLPEDADRSAAWIRDRIKQVIGKDVGVLIIDSHGRAWREGTVGISIGMAGIPGLVDLRGQLDRFGYELRVTTVGAADELAAGASLVMGQAAEGTPLVLARGFPYPMRESSLSELIRSTEKDMFR